MMSSDEESSYQLSTIDSSWINSTNLYYDDEENSDHEPIRTKITKRPSEKSGKQKKQKPTKNESKKSTSMKKPIVGKSPSKIIRSPAVQQISSSQPSTSDAIVPVHSSLKTN